MNRIHEFVLSKGISNNLAIYGKSFGDMVALRYSASYQVSSIILEGTPINTSHINEKELIPAERFLKLFKGKTGKSLFNRAKQNKVILKLINRYAIGLNTKTVKFTNPELLSSVIRKVDRDTIMQLFQILGDIDLTADLKGFNGNLLGVYSTNDPVVIAPKAIKLLEDLDKENLKLLKYDFQGHMPTYFMPESITEEIVKAI